MTRIAKSDIGPVPGRRRGRLMRLRAGWPAGRVPPRVAALLAQARMEHASALDHPEIGGAWDRLRAAIDASPSGCGLPPHRDSIKEPSFR
jgi:hypothetical protein